MRERIAAVQAQLDAIAASDLSGRLDQPAGDDEIARLVRTVNQCLDRLEYSVRQQTQFASDASHELRTPLAALRAEAESALMYPEDTDLVETVHRFTAGLDRLDSLVSDLLLLARVGDPGTGAREPIDLAALAEAEVRRRTDLPREERIVTDLPAGIVVVGVRSRLERVLANLLDNAQRHAHNTITVSLSSAGPCAVLLVGDDGDGIPEKDRDRVFDRFTRLDSARSREEGGTGLGLAIVHNIVASHHGAVAIEDGPAPGANFVVSLPLAPAEEQEPEQETRLV